MRLCLFFECVVFTGPVRARVGSPGTKRLTVVCFTLRFSYVHSSEALQDKTQLCMHRVAENETNRNNKEII